MRRIDDFHFDAEAGLADRTGMVVKCLGRQQRAAATLGRTVILIKPGTDAIADGAMLGGIERRSARNQHVQVGQQPAGLGIDLEQPVQQRRHQERRRCPLAAGEFDQILRGIGRAEQQRGATGIEHRQREPATAAEIERGRGQKPVMCGQPQIDPIDHEPIDELALTDERPFGHTGRTR